MLRIAIQSKGRLFEETMELLQEAGIKLNNKTISVVAFFILNFVLFKNI